MAKSMICANCGNVSNGKSAVKGSGGVELILWLFFIIPGVIYSIWRSSSRHKVCSVCGSANLIPVDSPNAKMLLEKQGKTIEQVESEIKALPRWSSKQKVYMVLGALFLLGIIQTLVQTYNSF